MNKKEDLEQSIEVQKMLIEIHRGEIQRYQAVIDNIGAELVKLDKPKLRHGEKIVRKDFVSDDYQYKNIGATRIVLYNKKGELCAYDCNGKSQLILAGAEKCYKGTGETIFDDLKRNSEDLERASIDGFVMEICGDRVVIGGRRFLITQAIEFHQKLGQLIATAQREAKKND